MTTIQTATLSLSLMLVAGCGGTESELLDALNADARAPLCVSAQTLGVDYFEAASDGRRYFAPAGTVSFGFSGAGADALPALVKAGYASAETVSLPNGFARFIDAYPSTGKIDPYVSEFEQLCIGELQATDIIEHTVPGEGAMQMVNARFHYRIRFNDLVDDLQMEDDIAAAVRRNYNGEGNATYVRTNQGWRAEMVRWATL